MMESLEAYDFPGHIKRFNKWSKYYSHGNITAFSFFYNNSGYCSVSTDRGFFRMYNNFYDFWHNTHVSDSDVYESIIQKYEKWLIICNPGVISASVTHDSVKEEYSILLNRGDERSITTGELTREKFIEKANRTIIQMIGEKICRHRNRAPQSIDINKGSVVFQFKNVMSGSENSWIFHSIEQAERFHDAVVNGRT